MELRFYLNPVTGEPHVLDHGVTETEVEEVMDGVHQRLRGLDNSVIVVGQTVAGR